MLLADVAISARKNEEVTHVSQYFGVLTIGFSICSCVERSADGLRNQSQELLMDMMTDEGIDQLNFHSAQLGYLKLLQMGTQTQQDKAGNKYEVKPQYEQLSKQLGGRHSNPVVTTPTIALDFSDTTQQSASHNVAPNQIPPGSNHAAGHFLEAEICYNTANILAKFLIIITLNLLPEANPNSTLLCRLSLLKTELKPQELLTQKLTLAENARTDFLQNASKSSSFAFPQTLRVV
ncbi:dihydroxy-acid dehydratase, mitochondrial [Dorcoceras hygrometricum]|uniref:Dihydroxy-acid dehydratase, mitochondrial n=1 Tax=Dorcoceras hygrometricum TaxID=472368 RepID=A0A2Z7BN03_9LAMI|nr:dihydroxy-acid dehydratase, mitochondrial [Dorcoceras hygrometricum]